MIEASAGKSWWLWLVTAVVMLVAIACSSSDDADPQPAADSGSTPATARTAAATPADEQVLRVSMPGEPSSLDPQHAADADSIAVLRQLYAGLLRLDENQTIQPDLAAAVPTLENGGISANGLTYTFKLNDGLRWSDGEPLVAQAFVDGARRLFEPGNAGSYASFYRMIAAGGAQAEFARAADDGLEGEDLRPFEQAVVEGLQVSAPDDRTVVYRLNARSPVFLLLTTLTPAYPVRQDIADAAGDGWAEAGTLVANGPFKLVAWDHDEDLLLEANEFSHRDPPARRDLDRHHPRCRDRLPCVSAG